MLGPAPRRSPRLAVILLCGSTLAGLCWELHRTASAGAGTKRNYGQWAARYEPLQSLLPADEVTRFEVVAPADDERRLPAAARLYLARYAVTPRRLSFEANSRLVVVDSDSPRLAPPAAAARRTLVADLQNGVRLYRAAAGD